MATRTVAVGVVVAAALAFGAWKLLGGAGEPLAPEISAEGETPTVDAAEKGAGLSATAKPIAVPAARSTFHAKGTVVDASGAAVPGVRVTARRTSPVWDQNDPKSWGQNSPLEGAKKALQEIDAPKTEEAKPDAEGVSGDDGSFDLVVHETGNYDLVARPAPPLSGTRVTAPLTLAKPESKSKLVVLAGTKFTGRVVDASDKGVAAVVKGSFTPTGDKLYVAPAPLATDPATGAFEYAAVPDGKASFTVVVPGRLTLSGFEAKTPYEGVFTIRVGAGGTLKGRVTNLEGEGVPGADVTVSTGVTGYGVPVGGVRGEAAYGQARARTSADGTWRVEGAVIGKVNEVSVVATGYTVVQQRPPKALWSGAEVKAGVETTIDVVVKKGGAVEGRVTEAGTSTPVEGVEVRLGRAEQTNYYGPPPMVTTGPDGRFRFDDVALGKYVLVPLSATHFFPPLEAAATGMGGGPVDPMTGQRGSPPSATIVLTKEGETAERNLEMRRGFPVTGKVVGPEGEPVEGAKVRMPMGGLGNVSWQWGVPYYGGDSGVIATSGADGAFEVKGLAPRDNWTLVASKDEYVGTTSDPFKLSADAPPPKVTLKLAMGGSIAGRVVDSEGKGLAGWNVWYWAMENRGFQTQANTTTDGDGAFVLKGLAAGKGQLQTNGNTGGGTQLQLDPPLAAAEKRTGVDLKIEKGVEVSGIVVDADGAPVPGVNLSSAVVNGTGRYGGWGVTKSDGTFVLSGVPQGKVQIQVSEPTDDGYGGTSVPLGGPIDAPAASVRLVYTPTKRITIRGRVTDPDGKLIPLVSVSVASSTGARSYGGMGNPNEAVGGEFVKTLTGSPPWTLTASAPRDVRGQPMNLKSENATVTDPAVPVVIVLKAGLELAGRILGPDGKGLAGVSVQAASVGAATDEDGLFRLVGLGGDAELDLVVQPPQKYMPPPPTKAKPGVKDLVLRLSLGATISGRVLGPDGKPVVNANVQADWKSASLGRGGNAYAGVLEDGKFKLEGLAEDAIANLNVNSWTPDGRASFRPKRIPDVRAGTDDLVVTMEAGVSIEGKVVNADGTPASFGWIQAVKVDGPTGGNTTGGMNSQAGDGGFTISGLEAGVVYNVTVQGNRGGAMGDPVKVTAPAKDVRIVVPLPSKLSGRLEGMIPGADYWAIAWPVGGTTEQRSGRAQIAQDGTFTMDVPADKDYFVGALYAADDRYALAGPVRAGASDVVLRFQPGAVIDGVLEDSTGVARGNSWVYAYGEKWQARSKTEVDGRFKVRGLPPGRYTLKGYTGSEFAPCGEAEAGTTGLHLRLPAVK